MKLTFTKLCYHNLLFFIESLGKKSLNLKQGLLFLNPSTRFLLKILVLTEWFYKSLAFFFSFFFLEHSVLPASACSSEHPWVQRPSGLWFSSAASSMFLFHHLLQAEWQNSSGNVGRSFLLCDCQFVIRVVIFLHYHSSSFSTPWGWENSPSPSLCLHMMLMNVKGTQGSLTLTLLVYIWQMYTLGTLWTLIVSSILIWHYPYISMVFFFLCQYLKHWYI